MRRTVAALAKPSERSRVADVPLVELDITISSPAFVYSWFEEEPYKCTVVSALTGRNVVVYQQKIGPRRALPEKRHYVQCGSGIQNVSLATANKGGNKTDAISRSTHIKDP